MSNTIQKDIYIITGTSRGIGEALVLALMGNDTRIFSISRTHNPRVGVRATTHHFYYLDFETDLSLAENIRPVMKKIFREIDPAEARSITLINNAGSVRPIRLVGGEDLRDSLGTSVGLNLMAPMLLTDLFIRYTNGWKIPRKVLNMSTGAATRPVKGWSSYCSTKAGLEMFTQCIAAEQADMENPVLAVAFAPGMVNTEMQVEIRNSKKENFPELDHFVGAKERGELLNAGEVAAKIIAFLKHPDFGKEPRVHIRQLNF